MKNNEITAFPNNTFSFKIIELVIQKFSSLSVCVLDVLPDILQVVCMGSYLVSK